MNTEYGHALAVNILKQIEAIDDVHSPKANVVDEVFIILCATQPMNETVTHASFYEKQKQQQYVGNKSIWLPELQGMEEMQKQHDDNDCDNGNRQRKPLSFSNNHHIRGNSISGFQ